MTNSHKLLLYNIIKEHLNDIKSNSSVRIAQSLAILSMEMGTPEMFIDDALHCLSISRTDNSISLHNPALADFNKSVERIVEYLEDKERTTEINNYIDNYLGKNN